MQVGIVVLKTCVHVCKSEFECGWLDCVQFLLSTCTSLVLFLFLLFFSHHKFMAHQRWFFFRCCSGCALLAVSVGGALMEGARTLCGMFSGPIGPVFDIRA